MSSPSSVHSRMPHLPALDGLRGVALLGVLFFHANGALPGGYLGVDLFFVLSGFLITSLLLREHRETGRIALGAFWVRRARRLFPALLSLMPTVAIYGRYFARADELKILRAQALATLAYVANWHAIFDDRSYWQLFAAPSPLEHTWSLSIEEQFYVLWPVLLAFWLSRHPARSVLWLSLAGSALSMGAMVWLFKPENTTRAYLGTDTRMTGILAGAALATLISPSREFSERAVRKIDGLGCVSACGLALAWWKLEGENPFLYHGGFWLAELAALALITCAVVGDRSFVARALSARPLRWLGTLSYGVYLWHWPVNVCLTAERIHVHGLLLQSARFALTFAIAAASYRFLERPIREHGVPFGRPQLIVPGAVALAIFLVVHATYARPQQRPLVPSGDGNPGAATAPDFVRYRVSLFGDSTANSLGWSLRGLQKKGIAIDLLGKDGCTMLGDLCDGPHWAEHVRDFHPNVSLIYVGGAFLHGFSVSGKWHTACYQDWDLQFQNVVTLRLGDLRRERGQVFVVTVPYPVGTWGTPAHRAEVDCINASLRVAARAVPGVQVLDLGQELCPSGVCLEQIPGSEEVRPDGVHFSVAGSQELARWAFQQIRPPD